MICPICLKEGLVIVEELNEYSCYNCGVKLTEEEYDKYIINYLNTNQSCIEQNICDWSKYEKEPIRKWSRK